MPKSAERAAPKTQPGKLDLDIYSVNDLSNALGIHNETILGAIKAGELDAFYLGGSGGYKIRHAAVLRWLDLMEKRTRATVAPQPA